MRIFEPFRRCPPCDRFPRNLFLKPFKGPAFHLLFQVPAEVASCDGPEGEHQQKHRRRTYESYARG